MNSSLPLRFVLTITSTLFAAIAPATAAAPVVEETVLGPVNVGGLYTLAPAGGHAAYMGQKDGKLYLMVDGTAGPTFEEIYKAAGGDAFFPAKAAVWPGTLGGMEGHDAPVLFSRDGSHHAYAGTQGADYVVIHDGREIGRGAWELMGRRGLTMSAGGSFVYWSEAQMDPKIGRTIVRTVVNGKPGPWTNGTVDLAFSANDEHYAYYIPETRESGKSVLIVDGKDAGYDGQQPVFTADGSILLTVAIDNQGNAILANGKRVHDGSPNQIVVAPTGRRWAATFSKLGPNNLGVNYLVVDGREVPGSDHVQKIWFSPDGKRYAAMCRNPYGNHPAHLLVDGRSTSEYTAIYNVDPVWTPDGTRVLFSANDGGKVVTVTVDADGETAYTANTAEIAVAEHGSHFAWTTADNRSRTYTVVVDGKNVLPGGLATGGRVVLSPDGSRHAFTCTTIGRNGISDLVIDGRHQAGIVPAPFSGWYTLSPLPGMPPLQTPDFVFSPDSQHLAYLGRTNASPQNALWLDGRIVVPNIRAVYYPTFTADSQHFYWVAEEQPPGSPPLTVVYVDGQPAVRANGFFFQRLPGSFDLDDQGVVTFLAVDGDVAKRYRIRPAPDVNVATLLDRAASLAGPSPAAPAPPAVATPAPAMTKPAPATPAAARDSGDDLAWNTVVRRPELWPTTVALQRDMRFQDGTVVRSGTPVGVVEISARAITVSASGGAYTFDVGLDDTDALAVARAAWAGMNAEQRALTYTAVLQRPDLWPYRVHATVGFEVGNRAVKPSDPLVFLRVNQGQLLVRIEGTDIGVNLQPQETDLIAQARAFLADERGAPGRVLEELTGKLVNPLDGRPVTLDANARPKYVILYMGAGWCAPCQAFSPLLTRLLRDKAPAPADVAVYYLSGDRSPAELKAYATKVGFAWPTIDFTKRDRMPAFAPLFGNVIPQLVVTDRFGKVLIDSAKVGYERSLAQLRDLL